MPAVLMEILVRCGLAAPNIANCITMLIIKLNGLTSSLDKKICLISNCSISESFHCIFFFFFFFGLAFHIGIARSKFNTLAPRAHL